LHRVVAAALITLLPSLGVAQTIVWAAHGVTAGELQKFIYSGIYPNWCGAAGQAAREMRVKPTTDPKVLHGIMKANITECANTSYAQQRAPLWNMAVFGAAAAALLAARHEPPGLALRDATHARNWSADIVKFTHNNPYALRNTNSPSMYRTGAYRMNQDAIALIAAINASMAAPPSDALPEHETGPTGSAPQPAGSGSP
jgi:hypothetical protein